MIVASLLLIVGAAGLLGLGLWQSSSGLLSGSIAASLLAAVVLVVGARRAVAARPARDRVDDQDWDDRAWDDQTRVEAPVPEAGSEAVTMTIPAQQAPGRGGPDGTAGRDAGYDHDSEYADDELDPPDEPAPQQVSAADAARVGRMLTDVLVVDGRPRYHLPGCVHLLGRESEPLPVGEAVELGFTPCSLCEPDSALLADARRV